MKLFVIYIGGAHEKSLIELHDMRFVVANTIEETYESLRKSWWGIPSSLHLDAWGILNYTDGHNIFVSQDPPQTETNKLYFVNLGGYNPHQFTELHKNLFVVATNESQAKHKALRQIREWRSPHRDYVYEVDAALDLNTMLASKNSYLHLVTTKDESPFEFTCCYTPIGKLR